MPNLYCYPGTQTRKEPWRDWLEKLRVLVASDSAKVTKGTVVADGSAVNLGYEPAMVICTGRFGEVFGSYRGSGDVAIKIGASGTFSMTPTFGSMGLTSPTVLGARSWSGDYTGTWPTPSSSDRGIFVANFSSRVSMHSISTTATGFSLTTSSPTPPDNFTYASDSGKTFDYLAFGIRESEYPPCPVWQTEQHAFQEWLRGLFRNLSSGLLAIENVTYTGTGSYPRSVTMPSGGYFAIINDLSQTDTEERVVDFHNVLQDGSACDAQTMGYYAGWSAELVSGSPTTRATYSSGDNRISFVGDSVVVNNGVVPNNVSGRDYELVVLRAIEGLDFQSLVNSLSSLDYVASKLKNLNKASLSTGMYTGDGGSQVLTLNSSPKLLFIIDDSVSPVDFYMWTPNMGTKVWGITEDGTAISVVDDDFLTWTATYAKKRYNSSQHSITQSGADLTLAGNVNTSGHDYYYLALG